ncbi:MAG: hypothetical protein LBC74_04805 [Planctomycetaceae bacterium]|jgi:hypothetical protein|nr:hypothetical protein [Planctomycetaceae bacterium]
MRESFNRKIIYLVLILFLAVLLFWMGRPPKFVRDSSGELRPGAGGVLARQRANENLMESRIGEVDPAGSAIKLATLGLRGVAIAILWHNMQEYQKRFDWSNVIVTAKQLVFLDPHFTSFWDFLGWNLAYNASSEFDDYRDRYRWVINGIEFLIEGTENNKRAPKLFKTTGRTISNKIGGDASDEREQYRRLFREDDDFSEFARKHGYSMPMLPSERDNWKVGLHWLLAGERLVLVEKVSIGKESDFMFCMESRFNYFNYAKWKRRDGDFTQAAFDAWREAGEKWREFARITMNTALPKDRSAILKKGAPVFYEKLETADLIREERARLLEELESLAPGFIEELCIERWKQLAEKTGQQGAMLKALESAFEPKIKFDMNDYGELQTIRKWLDKNEPDWREKLKADLNKRYTAEELELKKIPSILLEEDKRSILSKADSAIGEIQALAASPLLKVDPKYIAQELKARDDIPIEKKNRASEIADRFAQFPEEIRRAVFYRDILNYDYRVREVAVELTEEVNDARRLRYEGRIAYYAGDRQKAANLWYDAMQKWDEMLKKKGFEDISKNFSFVRDITEILDPMVTILDNVNQIFRSKFALQDLIRVRLGMENDTQVVVDAVEYAQKAFERGEYDKVEKFALTICRRVEGMNESFRFMKLAPLPEVRDSAIRANAMYINSILKQGKTIPDILPLRSFVELMIKHDEDVINAIKLNQDALMQVAEIKKPEDIKAIFDKPLEAWKPILQKYPLIEIDSTHEINNELKRFATAYADTIKKQNQTIPDNFPFKQFLIKN